MKKKLCFLSFTLVSFPFWLLAQDCPNFNVLMRQGSEAINYEIAYLKYNSAEAVACTEVQKEEANRKKADLFAKINNLREVSVKAEEKAKELANLALQEKANAELEKKRAEENERIANSALAEAQKQTANAKREKVKADSALVVTQAEQERNKRLVGAFYFYNARYALAYKYGKYGFVDPEGNTLINYKYDNATPFDKITGFALVRAGNTEYYLDTLGNEYLLARETANLSPKVKALDLSGHGLKAFPSELINLDSSSLVILNLSRNDLSKIPSEISRFQNLKYLNISDTRISSIPEEIGKLKNLRTLEATLNHITELPSSFSILSNLEVLNLRLNPLKVFPEELLSLTNLWKLDLAGTHQIAHLPSSFGQMNHLSELDLSNNKFKECPPSFSQLIDLKYLNLSENDFERWPLEIFDLQKLQQLDISRNPLENISPKLHTMKNLEVLNCGSIDLANWPVDSTGFENLQQLNIVGNPIKKIPETVCNLPLMKEIFVSGKYITEVPKKCENIIVINNYSKKK